MQDWFLDLSDNSGHCGQSKGRHNVCEIHPVVGCVSTLFLSVVYFIALVYSRSPVYEYFMVYLFIS